MGTLRLLLLGLLVLCSGPASAAVSPFARFELEIDGVLNAPVQIEVDQLLLTIPVVEVGGFGSFTKSPGTPNVSSIPFFLPEPDDEVLVAFFSWFDTLASGNFQSHEATITGFDSQNRPVASWTLTNAWVSKIVLPAMDNTEPRRLQLSLVLQTDQLTLGTLTPAVPWPDIVDVAHDRNAGTFTLRWRSIAGATYEVRGWDPVTKEPIVHRTGIVATGGITPFTAAIGDKGLFYAVLIAEPGG